MSRENELHLHLLCVSLHDSLYVVGGRLCVDLVLIVLIPLYTRE